MDFVLAIFAGLMGAAGVASAAAAAHATADPRLATMAQMLMIHAAAVLGILALGRGSPVPSAFQSAGALMVVGVCLFSGDLAARHWLGDKLFPMAAPIGGSLTIASWLGVAVAAGIAFARRDRLIVRQSCRSAATLLDRQGYRHRCIAGCRRSAAGC